jgi:hypothetical protein
LLFHDDVEALALWNRLTQGFPELEALCLMPDHIHLLLPHADERGRLGQVMSGYARWRAVQRTRAGVPISRHAWEPAPDPEPIPDGQKARRNIRYVLLNPCRKELVSDPLAWPWSTARDRLGFAVPRVGPIARDPQGFHRYVSGDPSTNVAGTPFPSPKPPEPGTEWQAVCVAARAITRAPRENLKIRGPTRTLAIRTAWQLGLRSARELSKTSGIKKSALYEAIADLPSPSEPVADPALKACLQVVGDPRFSDLPAHPLLPGAWRYAGRP